MKPDELLSDLTPCNTEAGLLVAAARKHAGRRQQLQLGAAAAVVIGAAFAVRPFGPVQERAPVAVTVPPVTETSSPMLTKHELLNTFGSRPVALVTLPDGRQKLLAIERPVGGRPVNR